MKLSFIVTILFFVELSLCAQAPEKMNYQAVVRNAAGELIVNKQIGVQVLITKDGGFFPKTVYSETHTASTNSNGLITLIVGSGTVVTGDFATIDWGSGSYTLNTNYDLSGGTNYGLLGASKLLSVPYALYAKSAGNATTGTCPDGTTVGEIKYWNGTEWITIAPSLNGKVLTLEADVPVWKDLKTQIVAPTVITGQVSQIRNTSVIINGFLTSDGGSTNVSRGICYSTTSNPSVTNTVVSNSSGQSSFSVFVVGLTAGTTYYAKAYASNSSGIVYGDEVSFTTTTTNVSEISIGDIYAGGIVGYILQPDDPGYDAHTIHGLIVSLTDEGSNAKFSCSSGNYIGTSDALGSGEANTALLVASCNEITAASLCFNKSYETYADWYLPSISELQKIYINRAAIPNFCTNPSDSYWSSTDCDRCSTNGQGSSGIALSWDGSTNSGDHWYQLKVRAIRSF